MIVTEFTSDLPLAMFEVPVARTPPGSCGALNVTDGELKQAPPYVMVTDATLKPTAAVAVAPLPPPPLNVTLGADV